MSSPSPAPLVALLLALALPKPAAAQGSLEAAWASAEAESLELRQAQARTREAGTLRLEAASMQLARVSTQWTAAFNDREIAVPEELLVGIDPSLTVPPLQTREALGGSLTVTQPLLRAALVPAVQAASRAWRAAQADEAQVRQGLRAAVARAYWGLVAARAGEEVAQTNLELAEAQAALADRRIAAGLEGRRAGLQGRLGVSRASRELLAATDAVAEAEAAWSTLFGEEPPTDLQAPPTPQVPTSLEEALATALARRPDLLAADQRWQALRKQRAAEDLAWAPTLDLAFQARFNLNPTLFNPAPAQAGVGLQLNWDLFDGGLRIARSQQRKAQAGAARLERDLRGRDARQDVRLAWHRLQRAGIAVEAVEAEVALAEEDLELASRGLEAGAGTLFEVQGARLSTAAARLARIRERTARDLAAIDLLEAMGSL